LLASGSSDVCKNTVTPIIVILDHSEVDMKVLDAGMETMGSDDWREVLEDDRYANSMLATIQEEARFFHKNK